MGRETSFNARYPGRMAKGKQNYLNKIFCPLVFALLNVMTFSAPKFYFHQEDLNKNQIPS